MFENNLPIGLTFARKCLHLPGLELKGDRLGLLYQNMTLSQDNRSSVNTKLYFIIKKINLFSLQISCLRYNKQNTKRSF